ncbi:MAG: aminodeoxychorismate synthase component I [Luteolibacter sp.]
MADPLTRSAIRQPRLGGLMPADVAARLRHLGGLVFFDTAGNRPSSSPMPVSVIAARPVRMIEGNVHVAGDRARLQAILDASRGETADHGFPLGGLCGWVGYEGDFVFGEFPEMLVFVHDSGEWWEIGTLSSELRETADEPVRVAEFHSCTSRESYLANVRRAQEWIAAGDIYQVNLSQSFRATIEGGSLFPLYGHLREATPAPMAAWLSLGGTEVLSSSPETFLRISGRGIETRPIKGTRPRFVDPDEDRRSAYELQTSAKEISELVMITDLLRNDIGQVCEFGSVHVAEMLKLETLEQVHHLVSTVTGTLREGISAIDALAACFPGGSITGAPKKRAMEIISELEQRERGLYCGAIGWFGFNGESQFNIAIRTLVREGDQLSYDVGGGIVADSDPQKEYEETLHKAAGIRLAIERWMK